MKILVSADMEGATGVTWPADCEPGAPEWERCRPMLTSDVMHGDVDGVVFLGYHTAAGTDGVLAHTYLPNSITAVRVNGAVGSEGRLNAHVAAEYGVPVILVTGDNLTCADAATYAPAAQRVAVKRHVARYTAECRPPARTYADIRAAAKAATALAVRHPPVDGGPFPVEVDVDATQLVTNACMVPTVERVGERSVRFVAPTAAEMIRCFKAVCTLISVATESTYG